MLAFDYDLFKSFFGKGFYVEDECRLFIYIFSKLLNILLFVSVNSFRDTIAAFCYFIINYRKKFVIDVEASSLQKNHPRTTGSANVMKTEDWSLHPITILVLNMTSTGSAQNSNFPK